MCSDLRTMKVVSEMKKNILAKRVTPKNRISVKKLGAHQQAEVYFDAMLKGLNRVTSKRANMDESRGKST